MNPSDRPEDQDRGRSNLAINQSHMPSSLRSSNPGSRANSRANSRTRHHPTSRPSSRPGSRPVSWIVRTNSEYANMFENYGGSPQHHQYNNRASFSDNEEDRDSLAEKGSAVSSTSTGKTATTLPKSTTKLPDYIEPSNEKLALHGATRGGTGPMNNNNNKSRLVLPSEQIQEDTSSSNDGENSLEEMPARGTVTPLKASLLLGKAFVGTGVLFLPKAFMNGGILFSCLTLALVAIVCCMSFLMLVKVRLVVKESFQDIAFVLFGKYMRFAVLVSVALSQIGFCCAYLIFVSQNIDAVVQTFTKCEFHGIQQKYYILIPLIVLIPLVLIRRMAILSLPSMLANLFIVFGIVYLWYFSIHSLAVNGAGPNIRLFNSDDFALFIGTAVFSFEGIGLVIPITESMAEPEKFPRVLAITITVVALIFGSVGALCYSAFGSNVQTIVVLNLPIKSGWTITVEILYSLAIILSVPLMLSPASKIIEHGIFGTKSGGMDIKIKWQKNLVRVLLICTCALVSFGVGGPNLDKFVSFVGSVACMPLCFLFPALFHYKVCAKTTKQKVLDILLFIFGTAAMIFTLYITIRSWVVVAAPDAEIDRCSAFGPGL
ncbi:neutral amino acid transporter [Gryganskiella cystojenkinii]|nr:neutral amino acid transporter [Gryganskiella cystojenkinii]